MSTTLGKESRALFDRQTERNTADSLVNSAEDQLYPLRFRFRMEREMELVYCFGYKFAELLRTSAIQKLAERVGFMARISKTPANAVVSVSSLLAATA